MKKQLTTILLALNVTAYGASITSTPTVMTRGSGAGSIVGTGFGNTNSGPYAVVAGGSNNLAQTLRAVISGGSRNLILGTPSNFAQRDETISGGESNKISGDSAHAMIGGGFLNWIEDGRYSAILGWQNYNTRSNGFTAGWQNTNQSHNSAIGGGYKNFIGVTNNLSADAQNNNVIAGGYDHTMFSVENCGISSGYRNKVISKDSANRTLASWIGSGFNNVIDIGYYCMIGGGLNNKLSASSGSPNYIFAGEENLIDGGGTSMNLIGAGTKNRIGPAAQHSVIVMGQNSTNSGGNSFIAAGQANWIKQGNGNFIIGSGLYVGIEGIDVFNIIDAAENAIIIGTALTNTTASSIELGLHDTTKSRQDANGLRTFGALGSAPVSVSLTADNASVSTAARSYIRLSSDNVTAANRTFVLTQGSFAGQQLTLEWVGTNAGELVDDSAQTGAGNHRLSATWTPTQYDTLGLVFNGTDWVEARRSAN